VGLSAIALSGLDRAQAGLEQTASRLSRIAAPTSDCAPIDTVDLSTVAVELLAARQDFAINIRLLKTADEVERQAVNLLV
jgi:hypothetical protein